MGLNKEPPQVNLNDISDIRDRSIRMPPSRTEEEVKIEEKGEVFMDNQDDIGQQQQEVDEEMVQKSLEELSDIGDREEGDEEEKKKDGGAIEVEERDYEDLAPSKDSKTVPNSGDGGMKFTIPVDTSQSD